MLRQPSLRFAFIWASEAAVIFDSFSFGGQHIVVSFGFTFMIALKKCVCFSLVGRSFPFILSFSEFSTLHRCALKFFARRQFFGSHDPSWSSLAMSHRTPLRGLRDSISDSSDWRLSLEFLVPGSLPPSVVESCTWFLLVPGITNAGTWRSSSLSSSWHSRGTVLTCRSFCMRLSRLHLILALQFLMRLRWMLTIQHRTMVPAIP